MISSINVASRPPYSLGQETATQPPSYNFFCQSTKYCVYAVGSSGKERSPSSHPFGMFSSNHVLNSSRKASSCFDIVKSICLPPYNALTKFQCSTTKSNHIFRRFLCL